jgi:NAD(P)-dependent dehydrogenase (short-subunit alcohol dehydrogenase family)
LPVCQAPGHDLVLADVAKADAVRDGLASRQFDGLVNNAGIAVTAALHASGEDDVRRVIDTNFLGSLMDIAGGGSGAKGRWWRGYCEYRISARPSPIAAYRNLCSQQGRQSCR